MLRLRIKEVSESRGINKSRLARLADLGVTTVNNLWSGERTNVQLDTLVAIANALNVSIEDLYEYTPVHQGKAQALATA
jgi:DNA-binding Xre family transcriptional regulator